tara:strand:+ start:1942 stop:2937 length:996 start_codon:yes stop_codon:yes gene_type:complete
MNNFIHLPYISFSLLAVKKGDRVKFIKENNYNKFVDYLHIDISDDKSSITLDEVKKFKKISKVPLDVHIAKKDPNHILKKIKLDKDDNCCIHVENNFSLKNVDKLSKKFNLGLAINLETPTIKLKKYLNKIKYVLFMAAAPGISGLGFNEKVINKIKFFKKIKKNLQIHADGGVNNINSALLREEKVNLIVSGSYLMKNNSIKKQLNLLMGENYSKKISHFSTRKIPKIDIRKKIIDSIKKIDEYKLGIVLVYNKKKLIGLISDGDIRRHLIRGGKINEELKKILNKKMIYLKNFSMINCIRKMKKFKSVSAIPIIDKNRNCIAIYNGSTH